MDQPAPPSVRAVRAALRPGEHARIEVEDGGGSWAPKPGDPRRGHGLDIISALASDWGVDGDRDSRSVWARFDWPSR